MSYAAVQRWGSISVASPTSGPCQATNEQATGKNSVPILHIIDAVEFVFAQQNITTTGMLQYDHKRQCYTGQPWPYQ